MLVGTAVLQVVIRPSLCPTIDETDMQRVCKNEGGERVNWPSGFRFQLKEQVGKGSSAEDGFNAGCTATLNSYALRQSVHKVPI